MLYCVWLCDQYKVFDERKEGFELLDSGWGDSVFSSELKERDKILAGEAVISKTIGSCCGIRGIKHWTYWYRNNVGLYDSTWLQIMFLYLCFLHDTQLSSVETQIFSNDDRHLCLTLLMEDAFDVNCYTKHLQLYWQTDILCESCCFQ